jgi:putative PIN family toxin of toxin-antitoxin system
VRIVVDTNVMIAAVLWQGPPHRILQLAERGTVTLCVTLTMLEELENVLRRDKFRKHLQRRAATTEEIIASLLPLVELYEPTPAPNTVPADPDDEIFIECALSASATLLVSGDSHLLRLKKHGRIRIVSPFEFLHLVQPEKR